MFIVHISRASTCHQPQLIVLDERTTVVRRPIETDVLYDIAPHRRLIHELEVLVQDTKLGLDQYAAHSYESRCRLVLLG